ncbi:MAG: hypothetical protein WCK01_00455 [Candidatus Uhrbacteria bacterium]
MKPWFVLLSLVVGMAAGCGDAAAPPVDPTLPPPGTPPTPSELATCAGDNVADVPVAALEWDGLTETFIVPGTPLSSLGIDFQVSPLSSTTGATIEMRYDATLDVPPATFTGDCLPTVDLAAVRAVTGTDGDIVRLDVSTDERSGHPRRGRVYAAFGTKTLRIRTADLGLSGGDWFVVIEPGAAAARAVFAPVAVDRSEVVVEGLPAVPMVVALARISGFRVSPVGALYSRDGVASAWRYFATEWLGVVLVSGPPETPVSVTRVTPPLDQPLTYSRSVLRAGLVLDATTSYVVVDAGIGTSSGDVTVSCGTELRIEPITFATVGAGTVTGAPRVQPGTFSLRPSTCVTVGETETVPLEATSLNGRPALFRLSIGGL